MKLLLTTVLVLAIVAAVPAFAQDKSPGAGAGAPASGLTGGDSTQPKADGAAPSASPAMAAPTTKDDCAKGGWAQFKDQKFKGETECLAFVEKHEKSK